jgi:hypothetical protein
LATHPAQAQLAGPAQVKVYKKTQCFKQKLRNLMNSHIYTNRHEGQMFQQYLASNVNLRGIFFVFGGLIRIATIIAAVARTFPVRVCRFFILIIFGRRLWQCSAFSSLLLLD